MPCLTDSCKHEDCMTGRYTEVYTLVNQTFTHRSYNHVHGIRRLPEEVKGSVIDPLSQ